MPHSEDIPRCVLTELKGPETQNPFFRICVTGTGSDGQGEVTFDVYDEGLIKGLRFLKPEGPIQTLFPGVQPDPVTQPATAKLFGSSRTSVPRTEKTHTPSNASSIPYDEGTIVAAKRLILITNYYEIEEDPYSIDVSRAFNLTAIAAKVGGSISQSLAEDELPGWVRFKRHHRSDGALTQLGIRPAVRTQEAVSGRRARELSKTTAVASNSAPTLTPVDVSEDSSETMFLRKVMEDFGLQRSPHVCLCGAESRQTELTMEDIEAVLDLGVTDEVGPQKMAGVEPGQYTCIQVYQRDP